MVRTQALNSDNHCEGRDLLHNHEHRAKLTLESGRGQVNTAQGYQTVAHEAAGGHAISTDAEKPSMTMNPTDQLTNTVNKHRRMSRV